MSAYSFGPPQHVITDANQISDQVFEEIATRIEQRGLRTSIANVVGFAQFLAQTAPQIAALETTTSTTYVDLATVGPTLAGMSDGNYLVLFGCGADNNDAGGGSASRMSIQVNATVASDTDCVRTQVPSLTSIGRAVTVRLAAGGNNTITAKYRSDTSTGSTARFNARWLIAIRYANL